MVITVVAVMKKGKIRQEQKNWKYKCASDRRAIFTGLGCKSLFGTSAGKVSDR